MQVFTFVARGGQLVCSLAPQVAYVSSQTKMRGAQLEKAAFQRKSAKNLDRQIKLFRSLWWVYSHCSAGRRCEVLPGDVTAMMKYKNLLADAFERCPGLFVALLRGKEGPWYAAVLVAWGRYCKRSAVPKSSDVPAEGLAFILQSAAREMTFACRDRWTENVGRNVSHHSGWIALLLQKGLLRKAQSARKLDLVKVSGGIYKIAPVTAAVLSNMQKMSAAGKVLLEMKVPRTACEWRARVTQAAKDAPRSETRNRYIWPWLVRLALIISMRAAGVKRLQVPKDLRVRDLHGLFPDQKQHLKRFGPSETPFKEFAKKIGYDGPLELLTMHLCFYCSCTMAGYCPEEVHKNRRLLVRNREQYESEHGLAPHCAVLCKSMSSVPAFRFRDSISSSDVAGPRRMS